MLGRHEVTDQAGAQSGQGHKRSLVPLPKGVTTHGDPQPLRVSGTRWEAASRQSRRAAGGGRPGGQDLGWVSTPGRPPATPQKTGRGRAPAPCCTAAGRACGPRSSSEQQLRVLQRVLHHSLAQRCSWTQQRCRRVSAGRPPSLSTPHHRTRRGQTPSPAAFQPWPQSLSGRSCPDPSWAPRT